ncbi:MAG: hypothetical protein ACLQJ7_11365 [Syntrophobacteraceae bacterium]
MADEQVPYNAGDAQQVAKAKSKQKTRDLQKKAALRKIMSDPEGRMWMWDLLSRCGVYHSSYSSDALAMAFHEGHRNIGLHLTAEINRLSPEMYARMVAENQEKEKETP